MSNPKPARRYLGRWVRSYASDLDDPARQSLSDALYRTLDDLERLAGFDDGALPPIPVIAFRLRLKPREVERRISSLVEVGLLVRLGEALRPREWDDRQYETTSTGRVQKHRERLRGATSGNGDRNGDETFHHTLHETRNGVSSAVPETTPATPPQHRGNDPPNDDETHTENQRSETESSSSVAPDPARQIDDDDLFRRLSEAADGHLGPGCRDVAPVRIMITGGIDLGVILDFLRERRGAFAKRPLRSFGFGWVKREVGTLARARAAKAAGQAAGAGSNAGAAKVFVPELSAAYPALVERLRQKTGRKPPRRMDAHGVAGWYFDAALVAAAQAEPPQPPREAAE